MNKVKAFIERGNDGTYGVYVDLEDDSLNYGIHGEGDTVKEAVEDFMMALLIQYMDENRLSSPGREDHPLFYNCHGGELTTAGVTYILKKYAALVRIINPGIIPEKISPHDLRTSRAMHWLQAGIDIYHIRDLLGHVSVQAIEKAYSVVGITEPEITSWEKNPKLAELLKSLA